MEKLADIDTGFFQVAWLLSAGDLVLSHKDEKVRVLDEDIKKRKIGGFCVDGEIIGIPDKEIKVPDYVLGKRDQVRQWRLKKQQEARYVKLGDVFTNKGIFTFFSCFGLLVVEFQDKAGTIDDESVKNTGENYFVDTYALFPNSRVYELEIPKEILEKRDEKRREYENQTQFTPIIRTNDEHGVIDFYIRTNGELLIKRNGKEATVTQLETIYGKTACRVDSLGMNHSYLQLPTTVVTTFNDMQKKLHLNDLQLVLCGKSVLDGRHYYKLSCEPPSAEWNKIMPFFVDFGVTDPTLNGMLTCNPERVSSVLGIKFGKIEA